MMSASPAPTFGMVAALPALAFDKNLILALS